MKNNTIKKYITEKGLCTGCGICSSLFEEKKIDIEMNKSGFYRPVFSRELSDEEYNILKYVCPALNMNYDTYSKMNTPLYGTSVECRIGWSTAEDIRYKASSGGSVTSFLLFLLEQKKIDGVIQVSRPNNPLVAEGVLSTTSEEIRNNIGSLYMPVCLLKNLKILLNSAEKVAIVGKGCDIRAVRRFVEIYPQYKSKIVLYIGILCGGSPSIKGTYNILDDFGIKKEDIKKFKYRGYGWPGFCTAVTKNDKEHKMTYNEAWAKKLGPTSPLVCKICFDGIAEDADIVFGDAWKCEKGNYPSFEETDGRNLIICRTELSRLLLNEAQSLKYLEITDEYVNNENFKLMQPSQSNRRYLSLYKFIGLKVLGLRYPTVNRIYLKDIYKSSGVHINTAQKFRTILGSIKRVRKGREDL